MNKTINSNLSNCFMLISKSVRRAKKLFVPFGTESFSCYETVWTDDRRVSGATHATASGGRWREHNRVPEKSKRLFGKRRSNEMSEFSCTIRKRTICSLWRRGTAVDRCQRRSKPRADVGHVPRVQAKAKPLRETVQIRPPQPRPKAWQNHLSSLFLFVFRVKTNS